MNQVKRALSQKNLTLLNVNNKGADQTVHLPSLISAFVIHSMVCVIGKPAAYKFQYSS